MALADVERKILVTGAGGFIGARLVGALVQRGQRVRVLDIQRGLLESEPIPDVDFVGLGSDGMRGGVADETLVRRAVTDVDVVYHLAINWNGHTWRHSRPVADLFDTNIRGTLNLLESARASGVKHFLFSSSCAVYGQSTRRLVDEESPCAPETWEGDTGRAYGIVKFATERLCLLYHREFGLPTTVFRIDFVFDESQALPSASIEENLAKGEVIDVVEGDGYSAIHVDDVLEALISATLEAKTYGQVFNLANPASRISYRELYELLIPLAKSNAKIRTLTDPLHAGRVVESVEKIEKTLGWRPRKTKEDLRKAIVRSLRPPQ